jgi:AcrR family transcriptional regulator
MSEASIGALGRRERLIQSAVKLFSAQPYDDVSVHDIASEADVATGLLYYHFTDKQGLYAAALELLADRLKAAVDEAVASVDSSAEPLDRLSAALGAQLRVISENPSGYRALLGGVAPHPKVRAVIERERKARLQLIGESLPAEVHRTPAVTTTLEGWLHFADGVQLAWLDGPRIPLEQIAELCVRVLIASVEAAMRLDGTPAKRAAKRKRPAR